jgi:hypothetical protein
MVVCRSGLLGFRTLSIIWYSKSIKFRKLDLFPSLRCPYTYESGSASLTQEPGSDIFHHTRMSGLRTLLVHFSIQNEFIGASCSSGDNTTLPNSAQFFPK